MANQISHQARSELIEAVRMRRSNEGCAKMGQSFLMESQLTIQRPRDTLQCPVWAAIATLVSIGL